MDKEGIIEGMMLASTVVEDAEDTTMEEARELSQQLHSAVDFRGYQFDVIMVALSFLLSAITTIVDEKAKEEGAFEDSRH